MTESAILDQLSQVLPAYMVPAILMQMDAFPLTVHAKLDKRALPDPDFNLLAGEYIAPTTESEAEICKIWQEILGLDRVGITDNFFKIGGNSILALQATHRMSKALGVEVKVADIFIHPTIGELPFFNAPGVREYDEQEL